MGWIFVLIIVASIIFFVIKEIIAQHEAEKVRQEYKKLRQEYKKLEDEVLNDLGFSSWQSIPYYDDNVVVTCQKDFENYNNEYFLQKNIEKICRIEKALQEKKETSLKLKSFLRNNKYMFHTQYNLIATKINEHLNSLSAYSVNIEYICAGYNLKKNHCLYSKMI